MSNFWPNGLELIDVQSPLAILQLAQADWLAASQGVMTLILQQAKTKTDHDMINVHASHVPSNRTATLFSVIHRPNTPYPVTIQLKGDDLPVFLKKSYHLTGLPTAIVSMSDREVINEWVSDTPVEFRAKLEKVFNLGIIKSEILSLVAIPAAENRKPIKLHVTGERDAVGKFASNLPNVMNIVDLTDGSRMIFCAPDSSWSVNNEQLDTWAKESGCTLQSIQTY